MHLKNTAVKITANNAKYTVYVIQPEFRQPEKATNVQYHFAHLGHGAPYYSRNTKVQSKMYTIYCEVLH